MSDEQPGMRESSETKNRIPTLARVIFSRLGDLLSNAYHKVFPEYYDHSEGARGPFDEDGNLHSPTWRKE